MTNNLPLRLKLRFISWLLGPGHRPVQVDVQEPIRKTQIREAEFQQRVDSESRVLRISGKTPPISRRIDAITMRGK